MEPLCKALSLIRTPPLRRALAGVVGFVTTGVVLFVGGCKQTPAPSERASPGPIISTENRGPLFITGELELPFPPPSPTPEPTVPPDVMEELRADRESLQAQAEQIKHAIGQEIENTAREQLPPPTAEPPPNAAVIREINFEGWPKQVVDEVMAKYGMRIEERFVTQFSRNTFVGHAAVASDHYYSVQGNLKPGIYKIFELSPRAVARLAALEEEELRRRGMNPEKTFVRRVVFGIQKVGQNVYDLGISEMDAQPLP